MSKNVKTKVICVLGMHRSGTSAITRALKVFGIDLGDHLLPAMPNNNEKGFWEDIDLNKLNIELLQFLSHDWHTLIPITHEELKSDRIAGLRMRAIELLRDKTKTVDIFGIKDPRMARLLPFWQSVFTHLGLDVRYVISLRNPLSVAKSLNARDKFAEEKSYYLWLEHVLPSILETAGYQRVIVDYDRLMDKPTNELLRIAKSLKLEDRINPDELRKYEDEFLEDSLRHTRYQPEDLKLVPSMPKIVAELHDLLLQVSSDILSIDSAEIQNCFARASVYLKEIHPTLVYMTYQDAVVAIRDKDVCIGSLELAIKEKDAYIADLETAMREKDAYISSLEAAIKDKDIYNGSLVKAIKEKDIYISSLETARKDKEYNE